MAESAGAGRSGGGGRAFGPPLPAALQTLGGSEPEAVPSVPHRRTRTQAAQRFPERPRCCVRGWPLRARTAPRPDDRRPRAQPRRTQKEWGRRYRAPRLTPKPLRRVPPGDYGPRCLRSLIRLRRGTGGDPAGPSRTLAEGNRHSRRRTHRPLCGKDLCRKGPGRGASRERDQLPGPRVGGAPPRAGGRPDHLLGPGTRRGRAEGCAGGGLSRGAKPDRLSHTLSPRDPRDRRVRQLPLGRGEKEGHGRLGGRAAGTERR